MNMKDVPKLKGRSQNDKENVSSGNVGNTTRNDVVDLRKLGCSKTKYHHKNKLDCSFS